MLQGFLLGLGGSFHCVGMCGPIALALPHTSNNKFTIFIDSIIYNVGRSLTYALMGAIVGLLGASINMAGYQEVLSVVVGVLMLLYVIVPRKYYNFTKANLSTYKGVEKLKKMLGKFLQTPTKSSLFILGILNGFLPCGLVYIALGGSLVEGSVTESALGGALYMAMFGLGTIPMMAAIYFTKNLFSIKVRHVINKAIPYGIAVVAILMILRGLSLGIPYVSPKLSDMPVIEKNECCH